MTTKTQQKALLRLAGMLAIFGSFLFAFSRYLFMRSMGESAADAAMLMAIIFIGILILLTLTGGALHYFIIPETRYVYEALRQTFALKSAVKVEFRQQVADYEKQKSSVEECLTYASGTFTNLLTEAELEHLKDNIVKFDNGESGFKAIENMSLATVTPIDLFHFGWNIGKRLINSRCNRKLGIETALFLKETFPVRLAETAIETISQKLTTTDGRFTLPRIPTGQELNAYVFPAA